MDQFSLVGFWKFKSNRIQSDDGQWFHEKLFGGTMAFSETKEACLFVRSDQGSWGYAGTYEQNGSAVRVKIEVSIAEDIEGKVIEREVHFNGPDEFVFSGLEIHTGRRFEAAFVRA